MKPDHKIDALVAERVMGFEKTFKHPVQGQLFHIGGSSFSFHPSTSIDDAWAVVSLMRAKGHHIEMHVYEQSSECMIYTPGRNTYYSVTQDLMPAAICLAALRASGIEV
jgi:hypothetical protein